MAIEFEQFEKEMFECIHCTAKGRVHACARNSIKHLERAWEIKEIDPEMAIFRAITAEEEAATAIFLSLKERGYENAEKISFKNHNYKQALFPFIRAISKFVADNHSLYSPIFGEKYKLQLVGESKDRYLQPSFYFHKGSVSPIPPLGFSIKKNGEPYYFEKELLEITSGQDLKDITKYIAELANLRNRLLYANHEGIPIVIEGTDKELNKRKKTVITLLRLLCLIFPHQKKAIFVQQALNAFLLMMGAISKEYPE